MNPLDEIAGLKWTLQFLLQMPNIDSELLAKWSFLESHLAGKN
jgi:hypothetical protein